MSFFEVDKEGLAKIASRRGKAFVLYELLQNSWDAPGTTSVKVTFEPESGRPYANLTVEDDSPDGFKNLAHAWTLFAESEKKTDATKRGRFNLGEKLVLALCKEAEIITTTGSVRFDADGRHTGRKKLSHGSVFTAQVRMTREEYNEALAAAMKVIPPSPDKGSWGITTLINGEKLQPRDCLGSEIVTLPTEIADEEGYLRRVKRQTKVKMYEVKSGEVASLYEMGIPVMETGDKFHVDVQQKIPLNMERDGVHPSYLRIVRAATLNTLSHLVTTAEEASAPWVRDAVSSPDIDAPAVLAAINARFGKDRVVYDPSDQEANNIAASRGMTVIPGGAMSKEEWANVRRFDVALPAGQVTPSPKPFHPDGKPLKFLLLDQYTPALAAVTDYFARLAPHLINRDLTVMVTGDKHWHFNAAYTRSDCVLIFNYGLMKFAVEEYDMEELNRLFIHELAHEYESNHLAEGFHDACCKLGAKLVQLALSKPRLFDVTK